MPSPYFISGWIHHSQCGACGAEDALCVIHRIPIMASRFPRKRKDCCPSLSKHCLRSRRLLITITKALADEMKKSRLVADLGNKSEMILRNHGLLTVGKVRPKLFCRCTCLSALVAFRFWLRRVVAPCCRCRIQYFTVRWLNWERLQLVRAHNYCRVAEQTIEWIRLIGMSGANDTTIAFVPTCGLAPANDVQWGKAILMDHAEMPFSSARICGRGCD